VVILFISACANPLPPSGGPRDKTPPIIVATEPVNNTINFHKKEIALEFNKYMDKNKVIECIMLSPTKKLTYSWSGKTLYVNIDELLDTNTTYSLFLGTEYTDYLQNKPTDAFTLTFSTGSHLDSGRIIGHLYDDNPAGVYIYGYLLDGINPDTLNISHTKPYYLTQVGTSGNFELRALKGGNYRIFAIRDVQKNGIYNEGVDAFGAAANDVFVKSNLIPYNPLKIGQAIDKLGPMLYSAEGITSRLVIANFSKDIDSTRIFKQSFKITDSANTTEIQVLSVFLNEISSKSVNIITEKEIEKGKKYKLTVLTDTSIVVKDNVGNPVRDTARSCYFYSSGDKDTTILKLIKAPFKDSSQNIDPFSFFEFRFNSMIKGNSSENRVELKNLQSGINVEFTKDERFDNKIIIRPQKKLESLTWYDLSFKFDSLIAYTGKIVKDSTLHLRFKTSDIRSYTSVSGILKNFDSCPGKTILTLVSSDKKNRIRAAVADSNKWEATEIPPANYFFEVFCDKNGNGKYDYGNPFPFHFAEPFAVDKKEVVVPPRFILKDVVIDVKK
jgi:hypothetical protein